MPKICSLPSKDFPVLGGLVREGERKGRERLYQSQADDTRVRVSMLFFLIARYIFSLVFFSNRPARPAAEIRFV